MFQLPNLLNVFTPWQQRLGADQSRALATELAKLNAAFAAREINADQLMRRQQELVTNFKSARDQANRQALDRLRQITSLINAVVPIGWLPLGVMTAAEGKVITDNDRNGNTGKPQAARKHSAFAQRGADPEYDCGLCIGLWRRSHSTERAATGT